MVGDQRLRAHDVLAGQLRVATAGELGQADEGVGGVGVARELDQDLRLELEGGDVAGLAHEHGVEMAERVLEHLVFDVDAGLEEDLFHVTDAVFPGFNHAGRHVGVHGGERARRYLLDLTLIFFDIDVQIEVRACWPGLVLDDIDVEVNVLVPCLASILRLGREGGDLGLDLARGLLDVLGVLGVPAERLAQHAGGGLLGLAAALALLPGELHHHADRLVDLADRNEGLAEQL